MTVQPMPTIPDLVHNGAIVKIDVELAPHDQPLRLLYGTSQFVAWLREVLDGARPDQMLGHSSIAEQIDDLFYSFLSGEQLIFTRQFRAVRAEENAVWELKTPDVRIFGWFMARTALSPCSEIGPTRSRTMISTEVIASRSDGCAVNWASMRHCA